jgi:flagellar motility protein MotE (MotC chaperone)/sporulation protein YlmC with PRC-barrel domain
VTGLARVFTARLTGAGVFDPNGDQVGKVRDVVVALRTQPRPPRVVGLVVEVPPRRRIFIPITRVTSIDAGAVIVTGLVNMRRFEQRPGEVLVVGELLDSDAQLRADGDAVTVLDLGMEQRRTRDWELSKAFVQRRMRTGIRRRAPRFMVDWGDLDGLSLDAQHQGTDSLLATFEKMRPADLAQALHELPAKRRSEVVAALDDDRLADVLEEMTEAESIEVLGKLDQERAADILEAMDPDDAADVLGELPEPTRIRLLGLMEPDEADDVRRLLAYDDYTAGGMMTTEPVILGPDDTVADALAQVRNSDLSPSLAAQVYVCRSPLETPTGRYLGTVHFQRLLREPPGTLVSEVVDTELEPLKPDAALQQVTLAMAAYNLVAMAVVDDADHLLGAVTVDDVIDHMLPDDWRRRDQENEAANASAGTATGTEGGPDGT